MKSKCTICKKVKLVGINYAFQVCKNCFNNYENDNVVAERIAEHRKRLRNIEFWNKEKLQCSDSVTKEQKEILQKIVDVMNKN